MKGKGYLEAGVFMVLYKLYGNDTWIQLIVLVVIIIALGTFFDWMDRIIDG